MKDRVLLTAEAGHVTVGSHIGVICDDPDEILVPLRDSFLVGLSGNDCCIFIASSRSVRKLRDLLATADVDVAARMESGDLVFITEREELLKHEVEFEPDHVLSVLGTLFQDRVRAGYDIVRLCVDASWLLRGTPGRERIVEFETKADETISIPGVPMITLCQYSRGEINPDEATEILRRHPLVFEEGQFRENPEYEVSGADK